MPNSISGPAPGERALIESSVAASVVLSPSFSDSSKTSSVHVLKYPNHVSGDVGMLIHVDILTTEG